MTKLVNKDADEENRSPRHRHDMVFVGVPKRGNDEDGDQQPKEELNVNRKTENREELLARH